MLVWEKLRLCMALAMTLLFLWTCSESLRKLRRQETSRTTTVMEEDTRSAWPSVTICLFAMEEDINSNRSFADRISRFPPVEDIIDVKHLDMVGNDTPTTMNVRRVLSPKTYNGFKYFDQCFTTDIDVKRKDRITFTLTISAIHKTGSQLTLHDPDYINPFPRSFNIPGLAFLPVRTDLSVFKVLVFTRRLVVDKDLDKRPCDVNNEQHHTRCLVGYVNKQVGCKWPFSEEMVEVEEEVRNFPNCTQEEQYERIESLYKSLGRLPNLESLLMATGCRRNCRYGKYTLDITYEKITAGDNSTSADKTNSNDKSILDKVTMHLNTGEQETWVETEVFVYELSDLLADFGGYLGLFLGASVMNAYDLVVEVLRRWLLFKK